MYNLQCTETRYIKMTIPSQKADHMNNYTIHSTGPDWFHFRPHQKLNPQAGSFTITYIPDGTVLMSGDLGCMTWQRHNFPRKPDYGFPYCSTGIEYFASKVMSAESTQVVESWKHDQAMIDIARAAVESTSVNDQQALWEVYDAQTLLESGMYGYHQMLEMFADGDHAIASETYSAFGLDYTDTFLKRFGILQSVSDMILSHVANR